MTTTTTATPDTPRRQRDYLFPSLSADKEAVVKGFNLLTDTSRVHDHYTKFGEEVKRTDDAPSLGGALGMTLLFDDAVSACRDLVDRFSEQEQGFEKSMTMPRSDIEITLVLKSAVLTDVGSTPLNPNAGKTSVRLRVLFTEAVVTGVR